jgi:ATP-dependent RNA helicase DHX29
VLQEHQLPEILRVGLEDIVLQILTLDLGEPCKFLSSAIDPPSALAMKNALGLLESLGAVECAWRESPDMNDSTGSQLESARCGVLDAATELTALGFHLSSLPVDPRIGKMMIYGTLFGYVDSALTIAAAMTSTKSLFVSPFDQRDVANEAHRALSVEGSDHMTLLFAFNEWKRLRKVKGGKAAQTFVNDSFLSRTTLFQMEDLRRHYASLLVEIGFLPKGFKLLDEERRNGSEMATSQSSALLRALLCAGLYPNIIVSPKSLLSSGNKEAGELAFSSRNKGDVYLHPCTVSYSATKLTSRYHCFYEVVRTSKMFVRDLTPVSPLALLLFGGVIETYPSEGVITVDEWLPFRISSKGTNSRSAPARRVALIKHLRFQLESILLQKIISPTGEAGNSAEIIGAIISLLNEQDQVTDCSASVAEIIRPYVLPNGEGRGGRGGFVDGRKVHSGRGRGRGRGRTNNRGPAG